MSTELSLHQASLAADDDPTERSLTPSGDLEHGVQFYEDEGFLCNAVTHFLMKGLSSGEPLVVIATEQHRTAFASRMRGQDFDFEAGKKSGQLVMLDARETLCRFMVDEEPDRDLFHAVLGGVIERCRGAHGERRVRAYGEMVDLLWRDGLSSAALSLEALWNEFARSHALSLLCGYSLSNFARESDGRGFDGVCRAHSHVRPTERCSLLNEGEGREREIAQLQQRSLALENEIEQRKALETALRSALDELRRSQRQLKDFVENAAEGLERIGADGTVLWANQAELDLLGYTKREYVGHNVSEFHADQEVVADMLARLRRAETLRSYEARLRHKNGSLRHVLINSNGFWRDGRLLHARWFTRDITARHEAETELRLAEERFRSLVNATAQVVWGADAHGLVVESSPSWSAFTGQGPEQSIGLGWLDAVHPDDRPHASNDRQNALAAMKPFESDYRVRRADGTYSWILSRAVPVIDPSGSVREWVGTLTDISARKKAEQERAELLAREQAARDQAEKANRMKDEFLAVLSHELRTPLNAILGWAATFRGGELDRPEEARAIETIERNAKIQAKLIDDMLDISRIIAGKLTLKIAKLDLNAVLGGTLDALRPAAEAKGVALEVGCGDAGWVMGDADRLQQVISNLLSNAIKFTPAGGRVRVDCACSNGWNRIVVEDDGLGIHPEFLPFVFDRFRQEDASISRSQGGLGLGLAIVRQLVELHGGTVQAESAGEAKGSRFSVCLPATAPDGPPADDEAPSQARKAASLGGVRVLLVEDEVDVRDLLSIILSRKGAVVKAVGTAAEALQACREWAPNVLVSDIGLPVEDGYDLIKKVRALPSENWVPAVAMTAYAGAEDARRAMIAGYQMHVPKPVDLERLQQVIAELAQWTRRQTGVENPPS